MLEALGPSDPKIVGPYRLCARLGSGSFGTVYAARLDRQEGQPEGDDPAGLAAVKVARTGLSDMADFPVRFSDEIDMIKRVESGFVPALLDALADASPAWMASELIPGPSLDKIIFTSERLPEDAVWHLAAGLVEALTAIHAAGCVHRDLKPKNVVLVPTRPWVVDFSLAHLVDDLENRRSPTTPRTDYEFMSPEEAKDGLQLAEKPADILGLAGTLIFAATGHPAVESPEDARAGRYNLDGLRGGLRQVVEECLRMRPSHRISLEMLKAEVARQTSRTGYLGFAALLPPDLLKRLETYQTELATALSTTQGPERLGWGLTRWRGPGPERRGGVEGPPHLTATRQGTTAGSAAVRAGSPQPVRWTSSWLGSWISGPVAVRDGRVVVACLNGRVAVLNARDGKAPAAWRKPVDVGAALHAGALLHGPDDEHRRAYVGAADGRIHAIDLASRQHRILVEAGAPIDGTLVEVGNRVCALSADGRVHSVEPGPGVHTVLYEIGAAPTGALSAAAGAIFVSDTDGRVHAIDGNTGQLHWQFPTEGLVFAKPLPVGRWVYMCGTDGVLRKLGINNGEQHATIDLGAAVHVAPVHNGNRLYVASSDGVVRAYDIRSTRMEELWSEPLGEEITGLAAYGGRVYVATGRRLVEVVEVDSNMRLNREMLSMDSLIGAPPVISGGHCYVAGLGGVVVRLPLS